jgi:glycosyltransferase involved in cell wall biosynthesis
MTILFLYTELAGYFVAGICELCKQGHNIHIVRWPVNKEAPFAFNFPPDVSVYERNDYNAKELLVLTKEINPDIIISSGWIDKAYLNVCKHYNGKIPTVLSMDNHWFGSLKQKLMCLLSPWLLHRTFSHAWVPGSPQKQYALKLGFKPEMIQTGFYSADVPLFAPEAVFRTESQAYPKRFIYVGRYIHAKGLDILFKAWTELFEEKPHEWELWCIGAGELFEQRTIHQSIKHLGFQQPEQLKETLRNAGVFVLPSRFEPWGVVVHEMAAAGFPMILSDAVGAATQFLKDGVNGFLFRNEDVRNLKECLKQIIDLPDHQLRSMAKESSILGLSHTPQGWANRLEQLYSSTLPEQPKAKSGKM